jgi:hypothetical protein
MTKILSYFIGTITILYLFKKISFKVYGRLLKHTIKVLQLMVKKCFLIYTLVQNYICFKFFCKNSVTHNN